MQGPNTAKRAEVAERRAEVVRLKARGIPYPDIARRLGISEDVARQDVSRAHKMRAQELRDNVDELVAGEMEELEALQQLTWRIAAAQHRKVGTSGVAARDEHGNPVFDFSVNLHAVNTLVKIRERMAKLLGYDAALKIDVKAQVVTVDAIDAAILGLREQLEAERANGA
jgi:hypothetical protein